LRPRPTLFPYTTLFRSLLPSRATGRTPQSRSQGACISTGSLLRWTEACGQTPHGISSTLLLALANFPTVDDEVVLVGGLVNAKRAKTKVSEVHGGLFPVRKRFRRFSSR